MKHSRAHHKSQLEHSALALSRARGESMVGAEHRMLSLRGASALLHAAKQDGDADYVGGKLFHGKYWEPLY